MSIVKINKRQNPFAQIDKFVFEDDTISWKAKGILGYLLSKPDGWKVNISDIVSHAPKDEAGNSKKGNGEDAVYEALKELRFNGYASLTITRVKGKIVGSDWEVFEVKQEQPYRDNPDTDLPDTGKPDADLPDLDNPGNSYKDIRNNDLSDNDLKKDLYSPTPENNNPEPAKTKEKITPKIPATPPKKEKAKSAADYSEQIREIVAYLNERSKSRYSDSSKGTVKLCNGRLSGGFSVDDFKLIIDHKCSQWLNDAKMSEYIRPETLFCEKHFEGYLNAAIRWNADGRKVVLNGVKGPITAAAESRSNNVKQNQHDVLSTIIANRKY